MNKKHAWAALALVAVTAWAQQEPAGTPAPGPVMEEAAAAAPAPAAPEPTWNELLAAKRYAELEARIGTAMEAGVADLASYRAIRRDLTKVITALPQTSARFDEWVTATGSGPAYLVRGEFLEHRAFEARGSETVGRTHPDAMARMEDLLTAAGTDFETALEKVGPRCDLCYAGVIDAHMTLGQRAPAAVLVDRAMQALDGGIAAPRAYLFYLAPKWGGSKDEAQRFVDRFAADGAQRPALPLLRGVLLVERSEELARAGKHEQALLLAQQAAATDPGNSYAWQGIVTAAMKLDRAPLVLQASERALALAPDLRYVLTARASVLLRGTTPLDAVPFLERAVAQGDEWALKALLPIVAAGQHGFKPDRARAEKICQSAIDALLPAGFACMGGLEYFGMGRPADKPRALQWFLEAADRGVEVAMVDAAVMLERGDGVPRDADKAIELLLRARAKGEPRADGHLQASLSALGYWQRVRLPELQAQAADSLKEERDRTHMALVLAIVLVGSLLWAFLHKAAHRPAVRKGERRQLRAGWRLRAVVLCDLVIIAAALCFAPGVPLAQRWWAWPVLGLALAAGVYLLFALLFTRIWFDSEAVHHRILIGGRTSIRFEEIVSVGGAGRTQGHYIEGRSGARIYVSQALRGAGELLKQVRASTASGAATQPASRI